MTTVPEEASSRASRRGDVAGSGLSAGPRRDKREEEGEPGVRIVARGAGDLIGDCNMAPGFMCEPLVFERDSAKNAPDVVEVAPGLLPARPVVFIAEPLKQ